ncbi:psuK, partial [Symbiodinium microadriaticum]
ATYTALLDGKGELVGAVAIDGSREAMLGPPLREAYTMAWETSAGFRMPPFTTAQEASPSSRPGPGSVQWKFGPHVFEAAVCCATVEPFASMASAFSPPPTNAEEAFLRSADRKDCAVEPAPQMEVMSAAGVIKPGLCVMQSKDVEHQSSS